MTMNPQTLVAGVWWWAILSATAATVLGSKQDEDGNDNDNQATKQSSSSKCGVYFARSTLPGAGFGMFAGHDFELGQEVAPGDLIVPYTDLAFHNGLDDISFLWNEYSWNSISFDYMHSESLQTSGASFGLGAGPNCYFPLVNIGDADPIHGETFPLVDSAGVHRRDPGAGAFTIYHGRRGVAWKDIPQGMELFLDYGGKYFLSKDGYDGMPTTPDYEIGDQLLGNFVKLRKDLDHLNISSSIIPPLVFGLIHELGDIWTSRVINTLPENVTLVDEIARIGTGQLHVNRSIRSLAWLEENGSCMDHIEANISTIPHAGRGAFLRRPIQKGEVVAAAPLIHIPNRTMLDMYLTKDGVPPLHDDDQRDLSKPFHKQLLINYCFGSRHFDILLCPYGVGTSLINHSKKHANAKLVWNQKIMAHPEWLELPPFIWAKSLHAGLAFDVVATRDLEQGEEIFLDYGDEWQAAWDAHVSGWKPPPGAEDYIPDYELNEVADLQIPTVDDEGSFDSTHNLRCREVYRRMWGLEPFHGDYYPCRATHRYISEDNNETLYNVEIWLRRDRGEEDQCFQEIEEVLFGVPRDIFFIEDQYHSRDSAQSWSFRHDMRIPDELIPDAWISAGAAESPKERLSRLAQGLKKMVTLTTSVTNAGMHETRRAIHEHTEAL